MSLDGVISCSKELLKLPVPSATGSFWGWKERMLLGRRHKGLVALAAKRMLERAWVGGFYRWLDAVAVKTSHRRCVAAMQGRLRLNRLRAVFEHLRLLRRLSVITSRAVRKLQR